MTASASEPCVVFVANRLPVPVDDGWKRRTYHVVRALAAVAPVELVVFGRHGPGAPADDVCLGARVTVHTVRPPAVPRPLALAASYVVPHPMQQLLHTTHALDETLARVAGGRRVIAAGCASVFLAHALQVVRRHADVRFDFIDTHNIDSLYYQRLADHSDSVLRRAAFAQTARRTRSLEADAFARAQETWVCSDDEAARLARDVPQARVRVLPNGATVPPRCPAPPLSGDTVLFFGRLDYEPNADAIRLLCTEIWPRVVAARPTA
ncbi:MAG: hypothetical protein MUF00_19085, partial [Gemmatimonadaceae bacterium]|nr:hypothetical protein [Gemmatimonadaceae bacterium]